MKNLLWKVICGLIVIIILGSISMMFLAGVFFDVPTAYSITFSIFGTSLKLLVTIVPLFVFTLSAYWFIRDLREIINKEKKLNGGGVFLILFQLFLMGLSGIPVSFLLIYIIGKIIY